MVGNDDFGGASGEVPTNGTVLLTFRGQDGDAEVLVEGSTAPALATAGSDCTSPELPAGPPVASPPASDEPGTSPPSSDERAERLFGPLESALRLSREVTYEPGLSREAPETQIRDVQRTLGAVILGLGEIAATLRVETASESDDSKAAADSISSGRLAAMEGNWDAALADYRHAFALAAPVSSDSSEFALRSMLPKRVLLLPELVATTPLHEIIIAGYVTGLNRGETIKFVELGKLSAPDAVSINSPVRLHERGFVFTLELGDIDIDPASTFEVVVPIIAETTTGDITESELTLIMYPRSPEQADQL